MKTFKTRHQFYLPDDLSEKLAALSARAGSSKTAILTDALRAAIDRRAGNELDERFAVRLDRLSRGQQRLEKQVTIVGEALGAYVEYQLTVAAHEPPFDRATQQLGLKRFQAFIEFVGNRLASPGSDLRLLGRVEDEDDDAK